MSELQKASWGWIGTQVHASTTRSLRLQLQSSAKRLSTHPDILLLMPRLVCPTLPTRTEGKGWLAALFGNGGDHCSCSLRAAKETFSGGFWGFFLCFCKTGASSSARVGSSPSASRFSAPGCCREL